MLLTGLEFETWRKHAQQDVTPEVKASAVDHTTANKTDPDTRSGV